MDRLKEEKQQLVCDSKHRNTSEVETNAVANCVQETIQKHQIKARKYKIKICGNDVHLVPPFAQILF